MTRLRRHIASIRRRLRLAALRKPVPLGCCKAGLVGIGMHIQDVSRREL
jgi:hypothetical protein